MELSWIEKCKIMFVLYLLFFSWDLEKPQTMTIPKEKYTYLQN